MRAIVDVAIVGSGPYGLSVSAQLSALGIEHRIFGPAMQFWRDMPEGIFLKSPDFATNVYAAERGHRFVDYCKRDGLSTEEPIPMMQFAEYGLKAQRALVPHLEQTMVVRTSPAREHFELELATGEVLEARRVVVTTGLSNLAVLPEALRGLPRELVTHTADHRNYRGFEDKEVAVVGRGSSALEAAALLHESGARPRVLIRGSGAWLFAFPPSNPRPLRQRIMYPMSVLGPGGMNFLLDRLPFALHYLPESRRVEFTKKHLGPWGPWWLAHRFEGKVPVMEYVEVVRANVKSGRLQLTLHDSSANAKQDIEVDHLIAGTGYEPDVERLTFLDASLRERLARVELGPRVSRHYESSVKGLYFAGPTTALSFGPLQRFVCGAEYASAAIARHVAIELLARHSTLPGADWLRGGFQEAVAMASHTLRR